MEEIVNRVANSSLVSLDLDEFIDQSEREYFDLKDALFQGLILREREFRTYIKEHDWSQYSGKNVGVFCSSDAIIPSWAFMLVATKLAPYARCSAVGERDALEKILIDEAIEKILSLELDDAKVVIKGCGELQSRDYAYFQLTKRLLGRVASIMYGEPCSTVPVYKRPR
ncbi:DUF2480 family protein [Marinoscillum furvescens]|uniref:Uncharacterized protein DUF2480 n=1 Tax=Marinoscillum furvescens DSM 4134 TaxID=1122208 RepID=A0A3D9L0K8_MARFU|nr:DUF2480 family protein [Marinoscillum furvescens]RED93592.1 uncharacterized protein DUF2480 [Marinoscillum furvescens DSM 4134]